MAKTGDLCEIKGEIELEWKIKDFFKLSDENNARYESCRFHFSGASWEIWIYPNGNHMKTDGWVGLFLVIINSTVPITLTYTLGLKTADEKKVSNVDYTNTFIPKEKGYGCPKLISREALLERKSELTPSDVLTVFCTLKNCKPNPVAESYFSRLQDVSNNLKEIYQKGKRTDFTLKVSGENICAHRIILETRSPVFAAMLNQDTKENQTGEVVIEDLDKSAMDAILAYIYSGDFGILTTEKALSLYAAAEKYDIKNVKEVCVRFILHNLSVEWVCDIIKFADLYNEEEVGRRAKEYFSKNAGEILDSDKWRSFIRDSPHMGVELLSSIVKISLPSCEKDK